MQTNYQQRRERTSTINWIANDNYTHAITLNTDRELSLNQARRIFGRFCHEFDRSTHRIRNMRKFPIDLRLRAIVFPENLATNAHFHGLADFGPAITVLGTEQRLEHKVHLAWMSATGGAGTMLIKAEPDRNWAKYCTKRYDGTSFFAAEYHPQ